MMSIYGYGMFYIDYNAQHCSSILCLTYNIVRDKDPYKSVACFITRALNQYKSVAQFRTRAQEQRLWVLSWWLLSCLLQCCYPHHSSIQPLRRLLLLCSSSNCNGIFLCCSMYCCCHCSCCIYPTCSCCYCCLFCCSSHLFRRLLARTLPATALWVQRMALTSCRAAAQGELNGIDLPLASWRLGGELNLNGIDLTCLYTLPAAVEQLALTRSSIGRQRASPPPGSQLECCQLAVELLELVLCHVN